MKKQIKSLKLEDNEMANSEEETIVEKKKKKVKKKIITTIEDENEYEEKRKIEEEKHKEKEEKSFREYCKEKTKNLEKATLFFNKAIDICPKDNLKKADFLSFLIKGGYFKNYAEDIRAFDEVTKCMDNAIKLVSNKDKIELEHKKISYLKVFVSKTIERAQSLRKRLEERSETALEEIEYSDMDEGLKGASNFPLKNVEYCQKAIETLNKLTKTNPKENSLEKANFIFFLVKNEYFKDYTEEAFNNVIKCMDDAIKLAPNNNEEAKLYLQKGKIYSEFRCSDEAITCFKNGIKCNPNEGKVHEELREIIKTTMQKREEIERLIKPEGVEELLLEQGECYFEIEEIDKAAACFRKILEIEKKSKENSEIANSQIFKRIIEYFTTAINSIQSKEKKEKLYLQKGKIYFESGCLDEAITCFKNGIKCNPNEGKVHEELREIIKTTMQKREEIERLIKPEGVEELLLEQGECYFEIEEIDKAAACFRKILEIEKKSKENSEIANSQIFKKIIKCFTTAINSIQSEEKKEELLLEQGKCYLEIGKIDEAAERFRKILKTEKKSKENSEIANSEIFKKIIECFTTAINSVQSKEKKEELLLEQGECYFEIEEIDKAAACFGKILEIEKKSKENSEIANSEIFKKIIKCFTTAINSVQSKEEKKEELLLEQGKCHFEIGKIDEAVVCFQKIIEIEKNAKKKPEDSEVFKDMMKYFDNAIASVSEEKEKSLLIKTQGMMYFEADQDDKAINCFSLICEKIEEKEFKRIIEIFDQKITDKKNYNKIVIDLLLTESKFCCVWHQLDEAARKFYFAKFLYTKKELNDENIKNKLNKFQKNLDQLYQIENMTQSEFLKKKIISSWKFFSENWELLLEGYCQAVITNNEQQTLPEQYAELLGFLSIDDKKEEETEEKFRERIKNTIAEKLVEFSETGFNSKIVKFIQISMSQLMSFYVNNSEEITSTINAILNTEGEKNSSESLILQKKLSKLVKDGILLNPEKIFSTEKKEMIEEEDGFIIENYSDQHPYSVDVENYKDQVNLSEKKNNEITELKKKLEKSKNNNQKKSIFCFAPKQNEEEVQEKLIKLIVEKSVLNFNINVFKLEENKNNNNLTSYPKIFFEHNKVVVNFNDPSKENKEEEENVNKNPKK